MREVDDIVSFMDVCDFDEEVVDARLKSIMDRKSFTSQHLSNIITLLNYKHLLNIKESDECINDLEFEFVGKLIKNLDEKLIDATCKIIHITLTLNPSSIKFKAEHLLQQLLCCICDQLENSCDESEISLVSYFKLCDSVLEAVMKLNEKLLLPFLDVPIDRIVHSPDEKLKTHFVTITVKRFFDAVEGYNILDGVWNCISHLENGVSVTLKALCILSNYYLPLPDKMGVMSYNSNIITQPQFWDTTLKGLSTDDASTRKLAVYLIKRAIDCLTTSKINLNVTTSTVTVTWITDKELETKRMWDNFFILMDSLEEKQSNIVLPSLQLFECIKDIGQCWLTCAYNVGLQHDNLQVKVQCAMYRLQTPTKTDRETIVLLNCLNDTNIYDNESQCETLQQRLQDHISDVGSFVNIINNIPRVKWSPVPIYHLSTVLGSIRSVNVVDKIRNEDFVRMLSELVKVQCNNIVIRKAFHRNLSHLVQNCYNGFDWKPLLNIINQLEVHLWRNEDSDPLTCLIKEKLNIPDEKTFFVEITKSYQHIDIALLYLKGHKEHMDVFLQLLNYMFLEIDSSNKNLNGDNLNKAVFLTHLCKRVNNTQEFYSPIYAILKDNNNILLNYVFNVLNTDIEDVENTVQFLDHIQCLIELNNDSAVINKLYNEALNILRSDVNIYKNIYTIHILNTICSYDNKSCHISIDANAIILILTAVDINQDSKQEGYGRLRNMFMSKACELIYVLLKHRNLCVSNNLVRLYNYVVAILECGGYSCLKWILSIIDILLPDILEDRKITFDVATFLTRTWNDIEEIKTNRLYIDCIDAFVNVLLNEALLCRPLYNNIVISYCKRIVEYASIKNTALYYLVDVIQKRDVLKYSHMVYIFSDILLATAVPRKDQRITENVIINLSKKHDFGNDKACLYTNFHIKFKSLTVLGKIQDPETLETLVTLIINKIEELFKNKQRYHSNSTLHRTLQVGLQHIMYLFLKHRSKYVDTVSAWCIKFLGKLPHQASIRIYLEWYIALHYYYKDLQITDNLLESLKEMNVPVISQFMILYWLIMHKIKNGKISKLEIDFVMNTLMEHTMGPTYSIRMYAQYLSIRVYDKLNDSNLLTSSQYCHTIKINKKTLAEASKLKEKSFDKLLNDVFVHIFDIVEFLTPCFIYNGSFFNEERENEAINEVFALNVYKEMIKVSASDGFFEEWKRTCCDQVNLMNLKFVKNTDLSGSRKDSEVGTIQKKYIPWKNMSDIDVLDMKQNESKSELIVVASLIDKLPNLGGMARTSEVFGVHTYVIDSMRHLQDKQFQGLSVSAERWVNVIEVRPGQPLKDYIMSKKSEGYSIIAAEQTSSSISLKTYKFPKKTLLLLGHEKEGVPCDILQYMEACVEIPQQGVVRSLNVHVTAAIFIWEYSRQIIL